MPEHTVSRADELEAEGHDHLAKGHALLALARRARTPASAANDNEWITPLDSPLGKRRTLAVCRSGALESSKIGRKILVRRASLEAYLERHRRDAAPADDEDLFGT